MNVLFLTLVAISRLEERDIYTDLLREFTKNGHAVYVISPVERRYRQKTHLIREKNATILRLRTGNVQKTNLLEKGISTVLMEPLFKRAIRRYFSDVKFDLILYSTPPITLVGAVDFVKHRDGAGTYLLLKDIFPQNAVDMGMMQTNGLKGLIFRHFRQQEKHLYALSDRIGCMSQANVDYVIAHNPEVDPDIVEVCPNSIDVIDKSVDVDKRNEIRRRYDIPLDKKVFVYGGNLGRPQGIPFLIDCLEACRDVQEAFFLIVGGGTEYGLLERYANKIGQSRLKLMKSLPKEDYDTLVGACDVGLIFLDHRFTIPNFPSRLLAYMQAKLPVLACTDPNTDVGKVIVDGGFGWWCESNDAAKVHQTVRHAAAEDLSQAKANAWAFLVQHYSVGEAYRTICRSCQQVSQ